ncbi:hypothetical protein [Psychrosphaera algicola]|uniref:Uncharacterized protein n=1 Tax=Psychrosphaera algicola TaxID=3023714 RepID=A0ABT5FEI0_9GAMM|nr:hypothetical protein [Psychrosphaera sp. G1-22]MDC2889367.1 hypothetical protein [Psychrosphaera sp. G1-22]
MQNTNVELTSSVALAAELKQKLEMFSKPLTDTESITMPSQTQSTAAFRKVGPLPNETMLVEEVAL